jgi:Zincin-like metallopeptidase
MYRFTNAPRGDDSLFPGPAADIQNPAAWRDGGEIEHLLRSGHKVVTGSRRPTCPAGRSSVPLFGRCSVAHGVISPYGAIQWQAGCEGKGTDLQTAHLEKASAEGADLIQMPPFETFRDAESYAAATRAHECIHWTKHEKRLARDFGRKRFGDEGYAREDDHAAYIASWLKVLQNDTRFIVTATSHAQRAADYLHGLQRASSATAIEPEAAAG